MCKNWLSICSNLATYLNVVFGRSELWTGRYRMLYTAMLAFWGGRRHAIRMLAIFTGSASMSRGGGGRKPLTPTHTKNKQLDDVKRLKQRYINKSPMRNKWYRNLQLDGDVTQVRSEVIRRVCFHSNTTGCILHTSYRFQRRIWT